MLAGILPRHLHILHQLSYLSKVPLIMGDFALLHKLAYIGSGRIVVPSNEKAELIKSLLFRDLDDHYPNRTIKI